MKERPVIREQSYSHQSNVNMLISLSTVRFNVLSESRITSINDGNQVKHEEKVLHPKAQPSISARRVLDLSGLPIIDVGDLLMHQQRETTHVVQKRLWDALETEGFCFLTTPRKGRIGTIVQDLRQSLVVMFPQENNDDTDGNDHDTTVPDSLYSRKNCGGLQTSDMVYISEKGVPMYRLGYEFCEDGVREMFRIGACCPDEHQVWPEKKICENKKIKMESGTGDDDEGDIVTGALSIRDIWVRSLGLMRHICDTSLDLLLEMAENEKSESHQTHHSNNNQRQKRQIRPHETYWTKGDLPVEMKDRMGDFSVLYAMHYFNNEKERPKNKTPASGVSAAAGGTCLPPGIAVKEHVDPSLLVLEPFLCYDTTGLQVWNRTTNDWMECDGPTSPAIPMWKDQELEVMLLFVGKAVAASGMAPSIQPTLHRVVTGSKARRTAIYEQKYAEFYPAPILD